MTRVNLGQIAAEIDRTPAQTMKLLTKMGYIGLRPRRGQRSITYDARALETLKALLGQPHRHISDKADDWLTQWIDKGDHHG
jgi:hypothetical protein